jgi:predicted dehydrogenase
MNQSRLTAVVIGAGHAGEGHTLALRSANVDVVAICARQAPVVRAVADRLGVAEASVNWKATLQRLRPDIVSIATPASLREEVIDCAADMGCHLLAEKPLAAFAPEAQRLWARVRQAQVKHAYASVHRYDPGFAWVQELISDGQLGRLEHITVWCRWERPPLAPWSWYDKLESGGGVLNTVFTHVLGILERITGGQVVTAKGDLRVLREFAPVIEGVHDFRTHGDLSPPTEAAQTLPRRRCDADGSFQGILQIESLGQLADVQVAIGPSDHLPRQGSGWRIAGSNGVIELSGGLSNVRITVAQGSVRSSPIFQRLGDGPLGPPQRYFAMLPPAETMMQRKWSALAAELVNDVRNVPHAPYLTFRDGWRYQLLIDRIRRQESN